MSMAMSDFSQLPTPDLFEWRDILQRELENLTHLIAECALDGIAAKRREKWLTDALREVKFQIGLRFRRRKKPRQAVKAPKFEVVGTQRISIEEARQHPIAPSVLFRPGGKEWAER